MADQILGKLSDYFVKKDGSRVKNASEWAARRQEIIDEVIRVEYGGMPPKPTNFRVEQTYGGGAGRSNSYRLHCDGFSFTVKLHLPGKEAKPPYPVVITGDGCWNYVNDQYIAEANRRGYAVAVFDRTHLAHDMYNTDRSDGLYPIYPDIPFSALSAWAWGYHRVMDALCQLDFADETRVGITGHSRGGKAVLLAGATDERIACVNPNNSGAGGCGCYHYHTRTEEPINGDDRSEELHDLLAVVPYWFGPEMRQYEFCEEKIPFDQHYVKALIAPRYFLETDALGDIWANPRGSWQTYLAAKEAWKLFGAEEKCILRFREGGHKHDLGAFCALLDLMDYGATPWFNPFPEMENLFDWQCPGK